MNFFKEALLSFSFFKKKFPSVIFASSHGARLIKYVNLQYTIFSCLICLEQDSPEVHANAAEILCAITRCAPPGLAAKILSPR